MSATDTCPYCGSECVYHASDEGTHSILPVLRWISIKQELPPLDTDILLLSGTYISIGRHKKVFTHYWFEDGNGEYRLPNYWMHLPKPPMPKPPKGEEKP